MNSASVKLSAIKEVLERRVAELAEELRERNAIAIEKSADQMDEIQYASERYLAVRNLDHRFIQLRDVMAALRRVQDGNFGKCVECESAINPKRLAALPWAPLCIKCQEAVDRGEQERPEFPFEILANAA
jgi:DnaK suppressor protein